MSDLVLIKKFQNTVEAEIAKSLLEQQGIHAAVSAADAGGTVSGLAGWGPVKARSMSWVTKWTTRWHSWNR
jgi:hypothetical protein